MSSLWTELFGGASSAPLPLVRHRPNAQGRDFVVGDLHGCYSLFRTALGAAGFRPGKDRVFSVGDLVDRGPQSLECLELLEKPWFFACRGNHEEMLISHLKDPTGAPPFEAAWLHAAAPTYTERRQLAGKWLTRLQALPYVRVVGEGARRFNVVHAELLDQKKPVTDAMLDAWDFASERALKKHACYGRTMVRQWRQGKRTAPQPGLSTTYCGHTVVPGPLRLGNQVYLDQGGFLQYLLPPDLHAQSGLILLEAGSPLRWRAYLDGNTPVAIEEGRYSPSAPLDFDDAPLFQ